MKSKNLLGIGDGAFYKQLLAISLPIMLQQLITTAMYMADTIMIGGLGELQLAGVGAANQITFLLDVFMFGVMSGASVFMAQYWGRKDIPGVRSAMGLSMILGTVVTALFFAAVQLFPGQLVSLFSKDPLVIGYGIDYLRIASIGYLLRILIYSYGSALKSCAKPLLPMISGAAALLVNVFFNYCFIFGNLGFPELGVKGAAIATLIGTVLDVMVLLISVYWKDMAPAARFRDLIKQNWAGFVKFLQVFIPVFLDDAIWAVGISLQSFFIARMGTEAFAAMMIVNTVDKLSFVFLIGIGTACAVMLGNSMGAGEHEKALLYSKRYLVLSALVGVVIGALIAGPGVFIPELYNVSQSIRKLSADTIRILGFVICTSGLNFTINIGILRSGGDTHAAALIDLLPLWLLALPAVAITGLVFHLPLPVVFLSTIPSNIVRLVWGLVRARTGGWLRTLSL
jgi:putative MATE family efflux protein